MSGFLFGSSAQCNMAQLTPKIEEEVYSTIRSGSIHLTDLANKACHHIVAISRTAFQFTSTLTWYFRPPGYIYIFYTIYLVENWDANMMSAWFIDAQAYFLSNKMPHQLWLPVCEKCIIHFLQPRPTMGWCKFIHDMFRYMFSSCANKPCAISKQRLSRHIKWHIITNAWITAGGRMRILSDVIFTVWLCTKRSCSQTGI